MKRTVLASILVAAASISVALADFELLLEDGQVLSGIDVDRKDGQYLLELETGRILSIPYELVTEVRITAGSARGVRKAVPEQLAGDEIPLDNDDRPASGMRAADPEVLAGDKFDPPRRSEQVEALGEPSRFSDSVIDHDWRPGSDWDRSDVTEFNPSSWANGINNHWQPSSEYTDRSDVTEFAPTRWAQGVPFTTWTPEDGFKKKKTAWEKAAAAQGNAQLTSSAPGSTSSSVTTCSWCSKYTLAPSRSTRPPAPPGPRPRPSSVEVRKCAEEIFEPLVARGAASPTELRDRQQRLIVRWIEDEAFARLPVRLYEATWQTEAGQSKRAIFFYSNDSCRLINGDLDELLGVSVSGEQVGSFATTAFNAALDPTRPIRLDDDTEKIQYALAVISLLLPGSTEMRVLKQNEQFSIDGDRPCDAPKRVRRKAAKKLADQLQAPQVERGTAAEVVQFHSWDRLGGVVRHHRVLLSPGGEVSMETVNVAAHLGVHACGDTP